MFRAFILTYDARKTPPEKVKWQVDALEQVVNWYSLMPGTMLLVSQEHVHHLSQAILNLTEWGKQGFLLVEAGLHDGYLPGSAWDFLNRPKPAQKVER